MAVLPIAKLGNPVLRKVAACVDPRNIRTKEFQQLIDDMFETMLDEPGIGLAAPQVSQSVQLVVMGCEGEGGVPATTSSVAPGRPPRARSPAPLARTTRR